MIKLRTIVTLGLATGLFCLSGFTARALNLPRIFSDNMVLQRDLPVKVWGWADAGQQVEVAFAGQKKTAQADPAGRWMVTLEAMKASADPAALTVSADGQKITFKNVLVGEVWICSGQSNMEWTMGGTHNAKEAIAAASFPMIRQFKVKLTTHPKPQKDLQGEWTVCSPATAGNFTAVGYHFGLPLHRKLNVPIGLINTSWGGTRIEPWTDPEGFAVSPKLKDIAAMVANAEGAYRKELANRLDQIEGWVRQGREALANGRDVPPMPALPEHALSRPDRPTAIYNAMVAPIISYGIRGAIWYQGESNNGEGMLYLEKMKALISSWRRLWGEGDFPFLYVQLAPYRYNNPEAPARHLGGARGRPLHPQHRHGRDHRYRQRQ